MTWNPVVLDNGTLRARIDPATQQLVSLVLDGVEYMHGGAKPKEAQDERDAQGWNQTEIVMFPLVGPPKDGVLTVDGHAVPMSQHGIARYQPMHLVHHDGISATHIQRYHAGTVVKNPKKNPEDVSWPFSYTLERTYALHADTLRATFRITNDSDRPMPFRFGWHPAFRLRGDTFVADGSPIALNDVKEASKANALMITAHEITHGAIQVRSDMGKMMLWSPGETRMCCIEPVTHFLVPGGEATLDRDAAHIAPRSTVTYTARIRIAPQH